MNEVEGLTDKLIRNAQEVHMDAKLFSENDYTKELAQLADILKIDLELYT